MDFVEGFPESKGKTTILVIVDRLSKYSHFLALNHPYTAKDVAHLFAQNIYKHYGIPKTIVSDRDPLFTSKFWMEFMAMHNT